MSPFFCIHLFFGVFADRDRYCVLAAAIVKSVAKSATAAQQEDDPKTAVVSAAIAKSAKTIAASATAAQ